MEKKKFTPKEMIAYTVMADDSRERTMSDTEASEALSDLLHHLRKRACDNIESQQGVEIARQYEICARMIAYFGTWLIAQEDIGKELEKN